MSEIKSTAPVSSFDWSKVIGIALVTIGGLIDIAIGVSITHNADPLWILAGIGILIIIIRNTTPKYPWRPTAIGGALFALMIVAGITAKVLGDVQILWFICLGAFVREVL
jgi:hypothetical protein